MAIRQKGTAWQVDVTVAGVRAPRVSCDTRAAALRTEAEFRAKMLAGVPPEQLVQKDTPKVAQAGTLAAILDATIKERWAGTKAQAKAVANAGTWLDALGAEFPVANVNGEVIAEVVQGWSEAGSSHATINRKLSALSVMLNVAQGRGYIDRLPRMPWRREYVGRLRFFTDDEVFSLITFVNRERGPRFAAFFEIAVETGMRFSELTGLTVRDVNTERGRVDLDQTKGNKRASIWLTKRACYLFDTLTHGLPPHALVFPVTLSTKLTSRLIRLWKEERGLPPSDEACFHTLRHTTCSRLVQRGVPLLVVKEFMRHSNIETTMRYAHLAPDSLDIAIKALERT